MYLRGVEAEFPGLIQYLDWVLTIVVVPLVREVYRLRIDLTRLQQWAKDEQE